MTEHLKPATTRAERIRAGDRVAFARFFREQYGAVVSYSARLGVRQTAAEDLAQEAFVRVWSGRDRIDPNRSVEALVFVTVRNLTLNTMRDTKNRQRLLEASDLPRISHDDPAAAMDAAALKVRIHAWIDHLPEREREAFTLSRFSDLSHQEIAEVMGISRQTVGKHITNALRTLRDQLATQHPELIQS